MTIFWKAIAGQFPVERQCQKIFHPLSVTQIAHLIYQLVNNQTINKGLTLMMKKSTDSRPEGSVTHGLNHRIRPLRITKWIEIIVLM